MPHTVLFVEDDKSVREVIAIFLVNAGFRVIEAASASEALQQFDRISSLDVVLTDFKLRDDGTKLVRTLKNLRPTLPVIVISGDPEGARTEVPQADLLLQKPISGKMIVNAISRLVKAA